MFIDLRKSWHSLVSCILDFLLTTPSHSVWQDIKLDSTVEKIFNWSFYCTHKSDTNLLWVYMHTKLQTKSSSQMSLWFGSRELLFTKHALSLALLSWTKAASDSTQTDSWNRDVTRITPAGVKNSSENWTDFWCSHFCTRSRTTLWTRNSQKWGTRGIPSWMLGTISFDKIATTDCAHQVRARRSRRFWTF